MHSDKFWSIPDIFFWSLIVQINESRSEKTPFMHQQTDLPFAHQHNWSDGTNHEYDFWCSISYDIVKLMMLVNLVLQHSKYPYIEEGSEE
jgi:hypothetical protein